MLNNVPGSCSLANLLRTKLEISKYPFFFIYTYITTAHVVGKILINMQVLQKEDLLSWHEDAILSLKPVIFKEIRTNIFFKCYRIFSVCAISKYVYERITLRKHFEAERYSLTRARHWILNVALVKYSFVTQIWR